MKMLVVLVLIALQGVSTQENAPVFLKKHLESLKAYLECYVDREKCRVALRAEEQALKSTIKAALQNGCATCTSKQRDETAVLFNHLFTNEKGIWKVLVDRYDAKRFNARKYEKAAGSI